MFVLQTDITDIMLFDSVLKWSPTHEDSAVPPDLVTVLAVEIEDIVETENTVETEETVQTENLKKNESLTNWPKSIVVSLTANMDTRDARASKNDKETNIFS